MFKEEEEAIKVDLHEGCGRTKLFWLMALADSKTMKAMVEFREQTGKCYMLIVHYKIQKFLVCVVPCLPCFLVSS